MPRHIISIGLTALAIGVNTAGGRLVLAQPTLDRVLNRVGQEVDRALQSQTNKPAANVPPNEADPLSADAEPGYLGIIADDRTEQGQGVRITGVLSGTPAATGKLAVNDLILAIDGQPIRTLDEMARILATFPAGAQVTFSVMRGGQSAKVPVTLGRRLGAIERPFTDDAGVRPDAPGAVRPKLGVRTVSVNDQTKARLQLPSNEGALVTALTAGSVAEQVGMRLGSVITQVNGIAVKSPDQLVELVSQAANTGTLRIAFIRDGEEITQEVPFGAAPTQLATVAKPSAGGDSSDGELTELEAYLDALERRVRQLEDRLEQLEKALAKKTAEKADGKAITRDEAPDRAAAEE